MKFFVFILTMTLGMVQVLAQASNFDSLKSIVSSSAISLNDKEEEMWQLVEEFSWTDAGYTMTLLDSLSTLSTVKSDSSKIMKITRYHGKTQRAVGNYVNSLDYYQQHFDYHSRTRDTLNMALSASQIGILNLFSGNMGIAQEYLLKAHSFYTLKGTSSDIAGANNGLANFYIDMGQKEKAVERYGMALEAYTAAKDTNGMANVHANTALILIEEKKFEEAERNLLLQGKYDSIIGTNWGLGFHHDFMGYLYSEQGRYDEAMASYETALTIREGEQSHYNIDESRTSLSRMLLKLERPQEAISQAVKIFDNKEKQQSLSHLLSANEILSEAYEQTGNYKQALYHHKEFKVVSDSIYNRDHIAEIAANDAKFDRVGQDNEIALLNTEKLSSQKLIKQKNRTIIFAVLGMLLVSILSFMLFRVLKKVRLQRSRLADALSDKELLIKEIHHRVKNNLQLVSSLLSMQSRTISDPSVSSAIEDGKSRVRSMALIHQDLYQNNNLNAVNVASYLDDLSKELFSTYNIDEDRINLELDIEDLELDLDSIIPLGLIINELITNSLKYAFPNDKSGLLRIKLRQVEEELVLNFSDNGIGYDIESVSQNKSFGTRLIKALTKQLDGQVAVASQNGTSVEIRMNNFETA